MPALHLVLDLDSKLKVAVPSTFVKHAKCSIDSSDPCKVQYLVSGTGCAVCLFVLLRRLNALLNHRSAE